MKIQLRNIFIVWLLTGLWHGASWNFVLWGAYYGVLLLIEKVFLLKRLEKLPVWLQHMYSLILVVIGWTIFAQTDFAKLTQYLKAMAGIGVAGVNGESLFYLSNNAVLLLLLVFFSIDHEVWVVRVKCLRDFFSRQHAFLRTAIMVAILTLSFAFLVGDSYNPFLYFRF